MKKIVLLLSLVLLLTACPFDREYSITIKNNSDQTIYACAAYIFPDTLLPIEKPYLVKIEPTKIGSIHGYYVNDDTFSRFEKGSILTFFILNEDSVNIHVWEYLKENNVILKRYEFNAQELNIVGMPILYP